MRNLYIMVGQSTQRYDCNLDQSQQTNQKEQHKQSLNYTIF